MLGGCADPATQREQNEDPVSSAPKPDTVLPSIKPASSMGVQASAAPKTDTVVVIKKTPSGYGDPDGFGMEVVSAFKSMDARSIEKFMLKSRKDIDYIREQAAKMAEEDYDAEDVQSEIDTMLSTQRLLAGEFQKCIEAGKKLGVDWGTISLIKVVYEIDNEEGIAVGDFDIGFMSGQADFIISFEAFKVKTGWKILGEDAFELSEDPY